MTLNLTICKASEVENIINRHEEIGKPFHAVISIEHPCDESVTLENGRAPRLVHAIGPQWAERQLILTCWDIEKALPNTPAPHRELVEDAIGHFDKWRSLDGPTNLLVHCRSGKARSTALGLTLLRYCMGPGTEQECLERLLIVRPIAAPNIAIVQHGDVILGCEGKLVQAVLDDENVSIRRAKANETRVKS